MNGALLQSKIFAAYGKAAGFIGTSYSQYRPINAAGALNNLIGTLTAAFDTKPDFTFSKPNLYPAPIWYGLFNGAVVQPSDYFVGVGGTYFFAGMQPLLPAIAINCNRVLTISAPQVQTGVGALGYGGSTTANATQLVTGYPASVLQGTKGEKSVMQLPGDTRAPWWQVLLPALPGGIVLLNNYLMTDELGKRYKISSAELSDLGWRITAAEMDS